MAGHKAKIQNPEKYGIVKVKEVEEKPKKKSIFKKKSKEEI